MLMNDEAMNASMPLRSTLQLGLSANSNQVQEAVKELRTGEPELTDWGNSNSDGFSKIMRHKEYSSENKEMLKGVESNDVLLIVLGQDGYSVFRESMNLSGNDSRKIEDELSSLIGSDILDKYSREHQRFGFDRDCVNVRATYVRDPKMLEDIDLERYFAISILEGSEIDFADDFLNWFTSSMADSGNVIPIVYSFSSSISPLIDNLSEDLASSTAASWLYCVNELNPGKQIDYLLHTFNQLFIEYEYGNTSSHAQSIMEDDYMHVERENKQIDALLSSCNLTSSGHNYFARFVGNIIDCHKKAFQKVQKLVLPTAFSRKENPRDARTDWLAEIIEDLCSNISSPSVINCVGALLAIHDKNKNPFDDKEEWRGKYAKETNDEKLLRWAQNYSSSKHMNEISNVFLIQKNGRNFNGGKEDEWNGKYSEFKSCKFFDQLKSCTSLVRNLHIEFWPFFKDLFNITDAYRYGIDAKGLLPEHKEKFTFSEISKVRAQIAKILLCDRFMKFTKDGGVVR